MPYSTPSKKQSYKAGQRAETLACFYLRLKGYRILERRFKTKMGEIDIIAGKGKMIIAVEVKYRDTLDQAAHAIPTKQWQRIQNALSLYLKKNTFPDHTDIRFDALLVAPGFFKLPLHLKNTWQP